MEETTYEMMDEMDRTEGMNEKYFAEINRQLDRREMTVSELASEFDYLN